LASEKSFWPRRSLFGWGELYLAVPPLYLTQSSSGVNTELTQAG
jgi:hypothetical protein